MKSPSTLVIISVFKYKVSGAHNGEDL